MNLLGRILWFVAFVVLTAVGKLFEWGAEYAEDRVLSPTKKRKPKKPAPPDEDDDEPDDEDEDEDA